MPTQTVHGVELYYELHGKGEQVVVLNNGIIASTKSWVYLLPVLEPHYRVLLYDMRGQGQSQKWREGDPDYTWEQHADDLAGLLDALEIEKAHMVGISYGGDLALVFALRHSRRCGALVAADAVSEVMPQLRAVVEGWILAAETGDPEIFYRATWYWNFSEAFFNAHHDFLLSRVDAAHSLDLPSVLQLCRCFLTLNITRELPAIQQPACVIMGEEDVLKPPHYARTMVEALPDAEYHAVPDAGHASFWEQPDVFNTIVLGFLQKQRA